ncbi:MAG: DUF1330 domain-containing protein [Rhodospirillales bacterium]|nr:DUF1330 domain-containing protein [Rhodospirillales bacterium]
MAAYVIVQVTVSDEEAYAQYREQVPATIAKYGGEYLVRGGDMEILEGEWPAPRCVVLKFKDMGSAKAWHGSEDYKGPMALRHKAAHTNAVLVDGI